MLDQNSHIMSKRRICRDHTIKVDRTIVSDQTRNRTQKHALSSTIDTMNPNNFMFINIKIYIIQDKIAFDLFGEIFNSNIIIFHIFPSFLVSLYYEIVKCLYKIVLLNRPDNKQCQEQDEFLITS